MNTWWIILIRDWSTGKYRWSDYFQGTHSQALSWYLTKSKSLPRTDKTLYGYDYERSAWKPSVEFSFYEATPSMGTLPLGEALRKVFKR